MNENDVIKEDYGKVLQHSGDLQTDACCTTGDMPSHLKQAMSNIHEQFYTLDKHHPIQKGKMFPVCGNTSRMLKESRFERYFEFFGDTGTHYGIYADCGTSLPFDSGERALAGASGGCC